MVRTFISHNYFNLVKWGAKEGKRYNFGEQFGKAFAKKICTGDYTK